MQDIKKRLRNYKFIKAEKAELEFQIQELQFEIGPGGLSYEDKGGPTYKISSSVESNALKIVEIEEALNKLVSEKGIEIKRIENALNMLSDKERQAIELRFIEDYEMATVCYKLDRSITAVKGYLKNGLNKMEKLLCVQK